MARRAICSRLVWLERHAAHHRHRRPVGDRVQTALHLGGDRPDRREIWSARFSWRCTPPKVPTLGVPQMVQTRGQFGSMGALLVVGIVIVMYVGFLSSNIVLGGEALAVSCPDGPTRPASCWSGYSAWWQPSMATTSFMPTPA
jgi:hypothetical protein